MSEDFSRTAALLGDSGRAAMLTALMSGAALPAGQLAMIGNIAPQTASSHLAKLVDGKLLKVETTGRHRFYRLANAEVAYAIEALLAIDSRFPGSPSASRSCDAYFAYARTCYSHLAGRLAVDIAESLIQQRILMRRKCLNFSITQDGRQWFAQLGITFTDDQVKNARFARACLDWTEGRYHIAGILGSMIIKRFRELKWLAPIRNTRALRVTMEGEQQLDRLFQLRRTQ